MTLRLMFSVVVLAGCAAAPPVADTTPTTQTVVTLTGLTEPAAVPGSTSAVRVTTTTIEPPTTTVAPFDPRAYCNGLDYGFQDMGPAMECFRVAALSFGISQQGIDEGWAWIFDVIVKESGGCWNLNGGDIPYAGTCSEPFQQNGNRDDTGFGQATRSYWGPGGKLCTMYGVCSSGQILASPYDSMIYSVIVPAMLDGRYGYCDYEGAPRWHNCNLVSRAWRLA